MYSFTIFGWAIGCGMNTFIFFAGMNIVATPIIYFFYPEVAGKSLEEINLLFTSDSPLTKKNMDEYFRRISEAGGNVAVAARRLLDEIDGTTHLDPRRFSITSVDEKKMEHNVESSSDTT